MRLATLLIVALLGLASAGLLGVALGAYMAHYRVADWRPDPSDEAGA